MMGKSRGIIRIMRKKNQAITLIELLIASSIFVVVVLTVYSAFHTGIFGYRSIEETTGIYQAASFVLQRINLDLRNSFAYSEEEAKFSGSKNSISFLTLVDSFIGEEIMQEYALVSYNFEGAGLTRLCLKNKECLKENPQTAPEELISDIKIEETAFAYGYMTEDGKLAWKDSWAGEDSGKEEKKDLPVAVKIRLILKNKIRHEFERTIYLVCQKDE